MPAALFVVATPIGNLEDITLRALRTLREVDLIAAEDTRRTAKLLAHYEIRRPVVSLHEHNEHREAPRLVARLVGGESIALVSDAGTPGISDPGALFVRSAREAGVRVIPIPGPSAVAAALSISGFPGSAFTFMGFPPASGQARQEWIDRVVFEERPTVFFEAPHRMTRTLKDLRPRLGERQIFISRETTKMNEISGIYTNNSGDSGLVKDVGEFTAIVGSATPTETAESAEKLAIEFGRLTNTIGFDRDLAFRILALAHGIRPDQAKNLVKKQAILVKRQKT